MKLGKFQNSHPRRGRTGRAALPLILIVLILTASIGGTLAYIFVQSGQVSNFFTPAQVSCEVNEDLSIKNTSNVKAYIRAMVVVNWTKTVDGQVQIYGAVPVEGSDADYTITFHNQDKWTEESGIYYYADAVDPGGNLNFVTVSKNNTANVPDGYTLTVEVVAEAIQAEGMNATSAGDAWKKATQPVS